MIEEEGGKEGCLFTCPPVHSLDRFPPIMLPIRSSPTPDDAAAKEERTVLTARNVDADRWRAEVERQAPKLKLTTDARDWRSHVDAAAIKTGEVKKMLPESRGVLERMHTRCVEGGGEGHAAGWRCGLCGGVVVMAFMVVASSPWWCSGDGFHGGGVVSVVVSW